MAIERRGTGDLDRMLRPATLLQRQIGRLSAGEAAKVHALNMQYEQGVPADVMAERAAEAVQVREALDFLAANPANVQNIAP